MKPSRSTKDYAALVRALCRPDGESEWVEYKRNHVDPVKVGQYISALANAAALSEQPFGYLLWGVEDGTGRLVGTTFDPHTSKKGNEPLQNWLLRLLEPQVNFSFHVVNMDGIRIVLAEIDPARNIPVRFSGLDYIRVGSVTKPLRDVPERERALWRLFNRTPFEKRSTYDSLGADEALGFLDWPAYLRLLKLPVAQHPSATAGTLAFEGILEQTGGDSWSITNFGALLLAESLSDFPHLERKAVRVIQYPDKSRIETPPLQKTYPAAECNAVQCRQQVNVRVWDAGSYLECEGMNHYETTGAQCGDARPEDGEPYPNCASMHTHILEGQQ